MDTSNSLAQATRDACFIQAGLDAAFRARLGDTTDVEFNFLTPSTDGKKKTKKKIGEKGETFLT